MTPAKGLVIACGALAREIRAVLAANGLSHLDLYCLPANLHNSPAKIPGAVEEMVRKHRHTYDHIFVAYADCGTGGLLQARCAQLGVQMIEGPHCYAFFAGSVEFAADPDPYTFYLTDFLARQFDSFVWRPLGLDQNPELLQIYFGHYKRVTYLAQTDDPALTRLAENAAHRMGLAFIRKVTGYGDLPAALEGFSRSVAPRAIAAP